MDTYEFLSPEVIGLLEAHAKRKNANRRTAERVIIDLHIAVKSSGHATIHGRASNMSTRGMFIDLPPELLPPTGKVELRSFQGDVMLCAIGDVVHMESGGIGVRLRAPVMAYEMVDGRHFPLNPLAIAV